MKRYKNIIKLVTICAGLVLLTSCDPDFVVEQPEQYTKLYMPQAVGLTSDHTLVLKDSVQSVTYGAAYGGPYKLSSSISVSFEAQPGLVTEFNTANETGYLVLPASSYELSASSVDIPAGQLASEPLSIHINPINGIESGKHYLLPVSITEVKGDIALNEDLKTTYFLINANDPPVD